MKNLKIVVLMLIILLTGCSYPSSKSSTPTISPTVSDATGTPVPPTQIPYVIGLGSNGFTLEDYQSELSRYQKAYPDASPEVAAQSVQANLIDELYLADGSQSSGFTLTPADLDQRISQLKSEMGGDDPFNSWLNAHGYTPESFRKSLELSVLAAHMRDLLAEQTPKDAVQVHVQQILFLDQTEANNILTQIRAGSDFATLAEEYDPLTKGDLGWFPKGYLTQKSVEDAAFALKVGDISEVITSEAGYHILKVLESSDTHPLSPGAYQMMQAQSIEQWLQEQRQSNRVEINLP